MKLVSTKKKADFLVFAAYYCSIVTAIFLTFKFLVPFFMPFIVGFLVAFVLKPITCAISRKTSLSRKICGAFVVIFAYSIIIFLIWFICAKIVIAIQSFASNNQKIFEDEIMPMIKNLNHGFNQFLSNISPSFGLNPSEMLDAVFDSIDHAIAESSKAIVVWIAKISATIPNFLIGLTFAVTSSIYISSDYVKIIQTINNLLPKKIRTLIEQTKKNSISAILKYIKAYAFLMLISFAALAIGFFVAKIENPIGIAALTAICDAVPFLGSGLIIFPWMITLILLQNFQLALKIGVIFLIVSVGRSFLEPKILGKQIGVHPVLTLLSVYVGMKLFGFFGIILVPITFQIGFASYRSYKKNKNS